PLGLEVRLERPVEVEVILGEVREGKSGKADAVEPPELGAVRGRLQGHAAVARVEHLAKGALEVDRLRGRPDGRAPLTSHTRLDGAEQTGREACGLEDRVEQECRRRFPARTR